MLNFSAAYVYETPYKGIFVITQRVDDWNGNNTIWCNKKLSIIELSHKSDTKVEDSNSINIYDAVNI